jgi:hypothetical protein
MLNDYLYKSPICEVYWAGWRSSTVKLQAAGWQLSIENDPSRYSMRLLMRHSLSHITAISRWAEFDMTRYMEHLPPLEFSVVVMGRVSMQIMGRLPELVAVDAIPELCQAESIDLGQMNIWKPAKSEVEEVLVDQADMTVIEHLQAIKDLQSDTQRELRDKMRQTETTEVEGSIVVQMINYRHA